MIHKNNELDDLANKLLQALSTLDSKGTNPTITQAMVIVHEGFLCQANQQAFTVADLVSLSKKYIS